MFRLTHNRLVWLRTALAVLMLGFTLNTMVHAAHTHDPADIYSQRGSCDHCVHFGQLADGPQYAHDVPRPLTTYVIAVSESDVCDSRTWLAANPRGPPASETL
jgi:hypothetical protein